MINNSQNIDHKDLMRREMLRQDGGGNIEQSISVFGDAPIKTQKDVSHIGTVDEYFYFESYHKSKTTDIKAGIISFSISELNNNKPIENVVQMKINRFYIPSPIASPPGDSDLFYFRQAFGQVMEISSKQSVNAFNNYFNFEFDIIQGGAVASLLIPIDDTLTFKTPISSLETFTLKLMIPPYFKPIPLQNDLMKVVLIPNTNPAIFKIVSDDTTADIAPIGVLAAEDVVTVFMSKFTSTDATLNNKVISTYGVKITTVLDMKQFSINGLDATYVNIQPEVNNMLIGKNRIGIKVRFTRIIGTRTNYMTSVKL